MKKILILLKNSILPSSFNHWIKGHSKKETSFIIFSSTPLEAINSFKNNNIDIFIMELAEETLEVLLFGIKKSPKTELIMFVNSSKSTNYKLFDFHIVKKPKSILKQKYLLKSICEGDYLSKPLGKIQIASFFSLIIFIKKQTILKIKNKNLLNYISFNKGYLWGARYGDLDGEQAILMILKEDTSTLSFTNSFYEENYPREIFTSFRILLIKYNNEKEITSNKPEKVIEDKKEITYNKLEKVIEDKKEIIIKNLTPYLQKIYALDGYLASMTCNKEGDFILDHYHVDYKEYFTDTRFIDVVSTFIKSTTVNQYHFIKANCEKASIYSFLIIEDNLIINVLIKPNANIGLLKTIFDKQ